MGNSLVIFYGANARLARELGVPIFIDGDTGEVVTRAALEPDQIGFLVTGDWCDRCGDQNYDEKSRVCQTCTFPDDPCSRSYLDARREAGLPTP